MFNDSFACHFKKLFGGTKAATFTNASGHQTDKSVSMGSVDAVPVAARDMQRQMGEFAVKALDLPLSERDMSGITMGLTRRAYERIKKELADCRRRIVAIASEEDETEQVYRLNLQLFPMSERIDNRSDRNENAEVVSESNKNVRNEEKV